MLFVASGWYAPEHGETTERMKGDCVIRRPEFHRLWHRAVIEHLRPDRTAIVDSASPLASPLRLNKDVLWLDLPENAGHSTDCVGRFSGWTLSVIHSLVDFINSGYDYYCYVEQDALLRGAPGVDLREEFISHCGEGILLGRTHSRVQPIQQSLFVLHRSRAVVFLSRLMAIDRSDRLMSPETKFVIASTSVPLALLLSKRRVLKAVAVRLMARAPGYRHLPIEGGRSRPLPDSGAAYVQHATRNELVAFMGPEDGLLQELLGRPSSQ